MSVWAREKYIFAFLGLAYSPCLASFISVANFRLTRCMGLWSVAYCADCAELTGQKHGAICWHVEERTKKILSALE